MPERQELGLAAPFLHHTAITVVKVVDPANATAYEPPNAQADDANRNP